ncbi:PfkB family carbohydrate kinase [Nocardioides piscis]|uniref:Carbohydrate kinase n=1 Tax=Nocardioides piscis TaxID=2714938 RepID=A0A6G7YF14_9ACTN|nr:PfkB family carbohydrate kinase [Nocardioides piscis]QIK75412.1 carbohydrate kinase [Nocardioides piscis]
MEEVALVAGETVADVVRGPEGDRTVPGGSAANAAVALARLGREAWLLTGWGDDDHGALLESHLAANGVRLAAQPCVFEETSRAVATIGPDGAADYDLTIGTRLPEPMLPADVRPVVLAFGSFAALVEPGAAVVRSLVERWRDRALVYYDVNVREKVTGTGAGVVAQVEALVAGSHLVKASDEDLAALWPGVDDATAAVRLLDLGACAVLVTRGPRGAAWFARDVRVEVPPVAVEVVDTIGAGDTLGAAAVDALWRLGVVGPGAAERLIGLTPGVVEDVLGFATRAAGVTVSRPGADPPFSSELG